jgi:hypothetical protein
MGLGKGKEERKIDKLEIDKKLKCGGDGCYHFS